MNEPSILDYLKSRLNPWQKEKIQIPQEGTSSQYSTPGFEKKDFSDNSKIGEISSPVEGSESEIAAKQGARNPFPWRILMAVFLALVAQRGLEPPIGSAPVTLGFYLGALFFLAWACFVDEFSLPTAQEVSQQTDPQTYKRNFLLLAIILAVVAFLLFSNNLFTTINVSIWVASLVLFLLSLWLGNPNRPPFFLKIAEFFKRESWHVTISRWAILLVIISAAILFFRLYRLDGIPGEPFSDHAEKLLDVFDITQGQTQIFFPRNTGREFIQFYLTAIIAVLFGTGLTFISLKLGTVLLGLFTLPYVYLIGKEVGGKRVALFSLILAGTSYWLNTISRIGLRFPLYPAFAAPALYHLIRGLRRQNRNDFILSGLFLGLGLQGYSPFRFVPIVLLLGLGLFLIHKQSQGKRKQSIMMFSILVLASFLVFLPLFRYAIDNPDMFSYRAMTRLTGEEKPLPAPVWEIFEKNTLNAMMMFNVDDGEIWVHSIPHRPALDIVSGILFVFGFVFLLVRYLRKREWLDLFLFLSVPMLLMPSILSLAFPAENPSLNRTGAAAVMVFVICGMALDGIYSGLRGASSGRRKGLAVTIVTILLFFSAIQNYNLVFDNFATQFLQGAWNTSDMGKVIRSFVSAGNSPDNAFVVPYPYWVDTRLVGIQSGYPTKDFALWREDFPKIQSLQGSKLFIVKDEDKETLEVLRELYPLGFLGKFTNPLEGKNFWIYTVPSSQIVNP